MVLVAKNRMLHLPQIQLGQSKKKQNHVGNATSWNYNIRRNVNFSGFSTLTMRRVTIIFFELRVVKNFMSKFLILRHFMISLFNVGHLSSKKIVLFASIKSF